jgi:hypothetical protein
VLPGFLLFVLGSVLLVPGLIASRSGGTRLGFRVAYSALFALALYSEPEVALLSGALPALFPPGASKKLLTLTFLPFLLLLSAGVLCLARGRVLGSWLSIWDWAGLVSAFTLLYLTPAIGRKAPARAKRGKR